MHRMIIILAALILCSLVAVAAPSPSDLKLSPSLHLLRAMHRHHSQGTPDFIQSVADASEVSVSVRFAEPADPADWERRGIRLRRVQSRYAGSGSVYGASMTWEEIKRWSAEPDVLMIASDWHPKIVPCLTYRLPRWALRKSGTSRDRADFPLPAAGS